MKWTPKYATGIPQIDEQHKRIFEMTEGFRMTLEEGGGAKTYDILLDFLNRYIRIHFGYEERCMEEYRCPAAAINREAHAKFTDIVADYRQRYATNGYRVEDAGELVELLGRWWSEHILHTDLRLKDHVTP